MILKYKPKEGFEIDKLTLLQKNGKYYYQYKTNDETFEETINKSIYEKIKREKELVLSLRKSLRNSNFKVYPFKFGGLLLVIYYVLCIIGLLVVFVESQVLPLLNAFIENTFLELFLKPVNTMPFSKTTWLIIFCFLFFQIILIVPALSSLDKITKDTLEDVLKPIKEKIETINFLNVETIKNKLNRKIN